MDRGKELKNSRIKQYLLTGLGLILIFSVFRNSDWKGSQELHTVMEVIATILSFMAGVLALIRYYTRKSNSILFIGAGFLGTSFLDCYHCVVTSRFFDSFMPSPPPSLAPWSWIASRVFLSICMVVSWLAWIREDRLKEEGKIDEGIVYSGIALFTVISFLFFAFVPLPRAYYPELLFGRPEEFIPALFFLIALIGYLKKGLWVRDHLEHWIVISLIVGLTSQVVFMSFSHTLFDAMFDASHLLKKASYICTLIGLNVSMFITFREAEDAKDKIGQALLQTQSEKEKTMKALRIAEKSRAETEEALLKAEKNRIELEKMNDFMVGRELKMKALKKQINELKEDDGKKRE